MRNAMWVGGGITGMGEIPMLGVKEKGLAKVIRDMFSKGEQGFFYNFSNETKRGLDWRRNLLTESGFSSGLSDLTSRGGTVENASFEGVPTGKGIVIKKNSAGSYAYKSYATEPSAKLTFSAFLRMADGSAPVLGSINADPAVDAVLVVKGAAITATKLENLGGGLYRASVTYATYRQGASYGLVKYAGNSDRDVYVSGYQLEYGDLSTYQHITDGRELLKENPSYPLFIDAGGLVPVSMHNTAVGTFLDSSKALKEGPELLTNTDLSTWTSSGAVSSKTANSVTTTGIGGVTISVPKDKSVRLRLKGRTTAPLRIRNTLKSDVGFENIPAGEFDINVVSTQLLLGSPYFFLQLQAAGKLTIDSISLKEVAGNHASQLTSAARPLLKLTPVYGSELLTNGTFDTDSSWSKGSGWSITGGKAVRVAAASGSSVSQSYAFEVGSTYELSLDYEQVTGTFYTAVRGGTTIGNTNQVSGTNISGKHTLVFTAVSGNASVDISMSTLEGSGKFDNVSLKKLIRYASTQPKIVFDGIDDKLVTNLPAPLTNVTLLRAVPGVGTQVKYSQTLPAVYEDYADHCGLFAINRGLSRQEQLTLMEELDKKAGATSLDSLAFKLFDNNQEGFVYDPNDLSTLYQDAAGSVPVTAVGQPVGFMLDKSKHFKLGPELYTGALPFTVFRDASTTTNGPATRLIAGKFYKVTLNVASVRGTMSSAFRIQSQVTNFLSNISFGLSTGKVELILSPTITGDASIIGAANGADFTIDSYSIREIAGNHAYQTTSASRPILRKDSLKGAYYLEFDGVDDHLLITSMPTIRELSLAGAVVGRAAKTNPIIARALGGYPYVSGNQFMLQGGAVLPLNNPEVFTVVYSKVSEGFQGKIRTRSGEKVSSSNGSGPFNNTNPILIGGFSVASVTSASINLYGLIAINKVFNTADQDTFLTHYHGLLGVTTNV